MNIEILSNIDLVVVSDTVDEITKKTISTSGIKNVFVQEFEGYNKSLNNGAKKGSSKWIAFCNNDLLFMPDWYKHIDNQYDSISSWCPNTHPKFYGKRKPLKPILSYNVGRVLTGWFILMKREFWEKLRFPGGYGFDERLSFWCCDNAASKQMKQAKIKHALIPEMEIVHLESKTLNKQPFEKYTDLTRNQVKLYNRLYNDNLFNLGY